MDPADCSALEFEAEMERLVKKLDGIPQSDSLRVMSEGLRALEAIVKINPQIQQFAEAGLHFSTISNSFIQEQTAPSPPPLLFTARSQDYRAAHNGESREHFSCSNAETVAHAVQSANSGREYYVLAPPEFAGLLSLVSCPQGLMRLCAQRLLRFLWSLNPRLLSFLSLLFLALEQLNKMAILEPSVLYVQGCC